MLARSQLSGFGKSEGTLIGFWESESTLGLNCCLLIRSQLPGDAPGDKWNCSFRTSSSLQLVIVCWKCIVESAAAAHSGVGCLGVFQKPSLSKLAYKLLWLLNCHVLCGLPHRGAIRPYRAWSDSYVEVWFSFSSADLRRSRSSASHS